MKAANLNPRAQKILQAAINHYIATAEPVGSKTLAEAYDFDLSAASIRHVLNLLDRSGLLYQPHPSAGRVPSDYGYRVYVDQLLPPGVPGQFEQTNQLLAQRLYASEGQSLEQILRSAAHILASLSGCLALITTPEQQICPIRRLHLLAIDSQKVIVTVISETYQTTSIAVDLPQAIALPDLERLNNFLNQQLSDLLPRELEDFLVALPWQELDQLQQYADFVTQSLRQLHQVYHQPRLGSLFISGLAQLMQQPEFSQLDQVLAIIQLLEEERSALLPLMAQSTAPKITIQIGSEIPLAPMRNCSLIASCYKLVQHQGTVGLLGPTRMNYQQAIAYVEATAHYLGASPWLWG
ncbi:MAG: heat-inducible transcriptional repressor HrcA [Pseudanabaenaceae cyanobacterium bins.68]|nr:heat-inducible transcriptional repressor HrcA [Pseudanabaenaceae cyanobacterium bins.68]